MICVVSRCKIIHNDEQNTRKPRHVAERMTFESVLLPLAVATLIYVSLRPILGETYFVIVYVFGLGVLWTTTRKRGSAEDVTETSRGSGRGLNGNSVEVEEDSTEVEKTNVTFFRTDKRNSNDRVSQKDRTKRERETIADSARRRARVRRHKERRRNDLIERHRKAATMRKALKANSGLSSSLAKKGTTSLLVVAANAEVRKFYKTGERSPRRL